MSAKWTDDETFLLISLIQQQNRQRINWQEISENFQTKTLKQCMIRYHSTLKFKSVNSNKISWKESDNDKLLLCVQQFGKNWETIATQMGIERNQAKNRYYAINKAKQMENVSTKQNIVFQFIVYDQ